MGYSAFLFALIFDAWFFKTLPSAITVGGIALMTLTNIGIALYNDRAQKKAEIRRKKEEAMAAIKRARQLQSSLVGIDETIYSE